MRSISRIGAWGFWWLVVACGSESYSLGGDFDGGTAGMAGGQSASGGTAPGGGAASGGTSSGGAGAVGGTGGIAASNGFGGSGPPTGCEQPLDLEAFDCDVSGFMRSHCARGGCHNAATASSGLDLTLDSLLVARLLDVPAKLVTTKSGFGPCIDTKCPPLGSTMLIDSREPEQSWMIRKTAAFDFEAPSTAPDMGCGTAMPYPPGGTGYTAERDACLTSYFRYVAATGVPCAFPSEPPPEYPTCPAE